MITKLVILDRDGVINVDRPDHVKSPDEWAPIPGSLEAITRLNQAGYRVVVATNQSGVGRGLLDIETLNLVHVRMLRQLAEVGGTIESIFFCPHTPRDRCPCRKPRPGLLLDIAERLRVPLAEVPVVGDRARDLEAAVRAGGRPVLVLTGNGESTAKTGPLPPGTTTHASLESFVSVLVAGEP